MASLNLQPNAAIFAIQTGIFLANYWVIKKTMVEPYLKVQAKRHSMTLARKDAAGSMQQNNVEALAKINAGLNAAVDEAKEIREGIKGKAILKRDQLFAEASLAAKEMIAKAQKVIEADLTEQRKKIPEVVNDLASKMYQQIVN